MKNTLVLITAIFALIIAAAAIALRPIRNTGIEQNDTDTTIFALIIAAAAIIALRPIRNTGIEQNDTDTTTAASTSDLMTETTNNITESKKRLKRQFRAKYRQRKTRLLRKQQSKKTTTALKYSPQEFRKAGAVYYNGYKFTYYSERVLPGPGLRIPGRHSDGNFVRDGDGYICVASSDLAKGTVVDTPFGAGKVYDTGCESGTIDIYCSW